MTRRDAMGLVASALTTPFAQSETQAGTGTHSSSYISAFNPTWTHQSKTSLESMPCGGGDIGLNVWVEDGDILFYMSRSGSFDETNAYLKLGRMRFALSPNPFTEGASFRQTLELETGRVVIAGANGAEVSIWVDVFSPVVYVDIKADESIKISAIYESWRTQDRPYRTEELQMHRSYQDAPVAPTLYADQIGFHGDAILSFHRNRDADTVFDLLVEQQGLQAVKAEMWNPLSGLTFGLLVSGAGLKPNGLVQGRYASTDYSGWRLTSEQARRRHTVRLHAHHASAPALTDWMSGMTSLEVTARKERSAARTRTRKWWSDFWSRSRICINPDRGETDTGWRIGRNYQLFRHQLGTNAYGEYPTKFNGGNFTTDPEFVDPSIRQSPDFRKWGGGTFTAQNQRLVYWPMLKSGDFDMMEAQFKFYERARENAELRSKVYWRHKGACFTEQMESFGLPCGLEYSWKRTWAQVGSRDPGVEDNRWIERLWETSLEFCLMILDVERFTGKDISPKLPLIESCIAFFDDHYTAQTQLMKGAPVDENGHIVFFPGTALETYKNTLNSIVTITALQTLAARLSKLKTGYLTRDRRTYYQDLLKRLPPLPTRIMRGHRTLAPAEVFGYKQNVEIPQLYPVFPYGNFGVGRPDLQLARDTWHYGLDSDDQRNYVSWHQDAIFCSRLGLVDEAKVRIMQKLDDSGRRYPTFWGPGHDWTPDHNWGGSGMIGLQEMLMQTVEDKIYLFPAWPRDWDVDFKLHAPFGRIVEGRLKNAELVAISVERGDRDCLVLPEWLQSKLV